MEKPQARSFNFLVPGVGLEEFSTPENLYLHATLRSKSKDWSTQGLDNVSEWSFIELALFFH